MLKNLITSVVAISLLPAMAFANPTGKALINKITKGQVTVTESFKTSSDSLVGYVIKPKQGGGGNVVFTNKEGTLLFVGNLINAKGQNLTQQYTQKYVQAKVAGNAFKEVASLDWFAQGSAKAPGKVYIIIDPNCSYCHKMYQEIEPLVKANKVQVRWIPVGFLRPDSAGMSAKILSGKTDKEKVALFEQNENKFKDAVEHGGLTPLKADSKDKADVAAFAGVKKNTAFFSKFGFGGTPTILYKDQTGTPKFMPGFVEGEALTKLLNSATKTW